MNIAQMQTNNIALQEFQYESGNHALTMDQYNSNSASSENFLITGTANARITINHIQSQTNILHLSTNNEVWWETIQSVTQNAGEPVVLIESPGPSNGSYTIGGYMRTSYATVIDIQGPHVPGIMRLLNSMLVSAFNTSSITSTNPITISIEPTSANNNPVNVTLIPAAAYFMDPNVF